MLHITVTSLYEYHTQYCVAQYQNMMMMMIATITCVHYKQQSAVHHNVACCSAYLHILNYSGGLHVHCVCSKIRQKICILHREIILNEIFEFSFHMDVFEDSNAHFKRYL